MFEQFTQPAVTMTLGELKAFFDAPVSIVRTLEERRALDMAKRHLRFEVGKRLAML